MTEGTSDDRAAEYRELMRLHHALVMEHAALDDGGDPAQQARQQDRGAEHITRLASFLRRFYPWAEQPGELEALCDR